MGNSEELNPDAPAETPVSPKKAPPKKKSRGVVAAIVYACLLVAVAGFGAGRAFDLVSAVLQARAQYFALVAATRAEFQEAVRENTPHPQGIAGLPHLIAIYPPIAQRLGEQGDVILRVLVLPTGVVGDAQLVRSSGYIQLDAAALVGVGSWYYIPAIQNHQPVGTWILVKVSFRISGAPV